MSWWGAKERVGKVGWNWVGGEGWMGLGGLGSVGENGRLETNTEL